MKKIISSAIAVAMLSSTVAMAGFIEKHVAPTPQVEKISATQTFDDGLQSIAHYQNYGSGANRFRVEGFSATLSLVGNPFAQDPETTDDKVIEIKSNGKNANGISLYKMFPNVTLNEGDIFKASFDVALKERYNAENIMYFRINDDDIPIFKLFPTGGVQESGGWTDTGFGLTAPNGEAFTHYEIIIDKTARTITIVSGTQVQTIAMKQGFEINSITNFQVRFQHAGAETGKFYLNNMSYKMVRATSEKLETFDTLLPVSKAYPNKFSGTLPKATYNFPEGGTISTTQTIDPTRDSVFALESSGNPNSYIAMPLNYTIDNDDVFTFKFDYAQDRHSETKEYESSADNSYVYLNDFSNSDGKSVARNFTATNVNNPAETYNRTNSLLFAVKGGQIVLFNNKWGWPRAGLTTEFSTVTVVIDNSDDAYDNKCTLAIYVDGELYENTKWYLEDNDSEATSIKNIDGVSITFQNTGLNRYFDNMYATLTDKKISVAGDVASYTYPVVYADETAATADTNSIFVKAYYDENNRLLSAETASAAPSNYSRTATTALNVPNGTARTKVFRWDSLTGIKKLSPAFDSNPQQPANPGTGAGE